MKSLLIIIISLVCGYAGFLLGGSMEQRRSIQVAKGAKSERQVSDARVLSRRGESPIDLKSDEASLLKKNRFINELEKEMSLVNLAQDDIVGALQNALELKRPELINSVLKQCNEDNFHLACEWLKNQNLTEQEVSQYLLSAYRGLASSNHNYALEHAEGVQDSRLKDQIFSIVIEEWAIKAPLQVFSWMETREVSPMLMHSYQRLMKNQIMNDPDAYKLLVAEFADGKMKEKFSSQLGESLARKNPQDAVQWLNSLEGAEKGAALQGVVGGWSMGENGIEVLGFLEQYRDESTYLNTFRTAAVNLAYGKRIELMEKFDALSSREQRLAAEHLAISLSMNDPQEALSWSESLPEGNVKDKALSRVASQLGGSHTEEAFRLGVQISNAETRIRTLKEIVQGVSGVRPELATNLINQASNTLEATEYNELSKLIQSSEQVSDLLIPSQ